ncbi:MAG: class I SAM-dependent methyltransferase [Magnetococcales bacterium]|nr:class I SAM-dependent methyltransferase [Magnetococcales bacterium]
MAEVTDRDSIDNRQQYNSAMASTYYAEFQTLFPKERIAFQYIQEGSFILDLGCGAGRTTEYFHKMGHRVIGVDYAHAMTRSAMVKNPAIRFCTADACNLGFRDTLFDVVVFSFNGIDCIHPYEQRLQALREIKRVVKPGGMFVFSSHNNAIPRDWDGILPFLKTIFKKKRDSVLHDFSYPWGGIKLYLTTPDLQVEELAKIGFEGISVIPRKSLSDVKSLKLLGWLDDWCYYICTRPME